MRSPRLAALELRRFGRGKLPRLGLVALMLIPLLYGALYLCSFWDPYSRLDKIPVALVNEDQGATADGKKLTAGADLARNVKDSKTFDWEQVSAAEAAKGLEKGDYYLSLTVPKDFSERIASSGGDDPQTGALQVRTNDANNYIVGSISKTVFSEIRAKTSAKSSRAFLDKIFVSFSDLHDETAKAADGAGKVNDGLGTAKEKTGELADGLGKLNDGAGKLDKGAGDLSNGLGTLGKGAGDLNNGLGTLQNGVSQAAAKSKELSQGASQVANGTQQLVDQIGGLAKKDLPYLKQHGKEIADGARFVVKVTEDVDDFLSKLPANSSKAAAQARKNADDAQALYEARCTGGNTDADCARLKGIAVGTADGADLAKKVDNAIAQADFGQLRAKLREVQQGAQMVADQVPDIVKNADGQLAQLNKLNAGAHQVAQGAGQFAGGLGALTDGAGRLQNGAGDLQNGAGRLQNGAGDLANGAGQLHDGLGTAHDGAEKLSGGLYKLKDGANQLATGLHSGVAKIPDYDKKDRDTRTDVMSDPVKLAAKSMHKAPNYGTGLAPYFIPLSLWVGAMVAYMLLAPLGKRALAAGAPGWRIALGSWLPAFAIGVVQVLALMAVLHWALGLEMERAGATIGFLMLGTACFTALIQLLSAFFGPAGRVLTLVVLMLQLTSAGGTYPVQTSPGFFSWIHPFLPMSYVVDGLRRLITGGDLDIVWQGSIVLAAFTVGALALTALAARSRQVVRMKDLHPELSL
ncbi:MULTISPECIES: YhgE/Pip domain-containing protein [unclassified Streptomyces]|uniref:YhgE/Pip domain-containing protein n=1 Tax=unclassified Streptomyces TaxID=2593676 RepID=UPI0003643130|nr:MULTISPECIES: YhgE/Pip domain-containing protein [unclassified Streptomyces]MYT30508.1 ABC transporter permease [Streptomyces sp. SID8354]